MAADAPSSRWATLASVTALVVFTVPKLWFHATQYLLGFDDVYYFGWGLDAFEHPSLLMAPDYAGRPHPLLVGVLGACARWFGPEALPPAVLLLAGHALSALLVARLAGLLGIPSHGRLIAGIAFLCFAAPASLFATIALVGGVLSVTLALLGLVALGESLSGGLAWWALLYPVAYLASLACFEYAAMTPLLGLLLQLAMGRREGRGSRSWLAHGPALVVLGAVAVSALSGAPRASYRLTLGSSSLLRLAALPRELAQDLLVPHAGVVSGQAARVAIALSVVALAAQALAPHLGLLARAIQSRSSLYALAWIPVAAAPFVLRPSGSVWSSRYLYFPGIGLALLLGAWIGPILPALGRSRRVVLALAALTALAVNLAGGELILRKSRDDWDGALARERLPGAFPLFRLLNREPPPREAVVTVAGWPFTPRELELACSHYVRTRPRCQVHESRSAQRALRWEELTDD